MRFTWTVIALGLLAGCPPKQPVESATPDPMATDAPAPAAPRPAVKSAKDVPVHVQVNEAASLIENGGAADLEKAIRILEEVAPQDASGMARFNLGVAYQARGDLNQASNQYQAVIATNPALGDAWLYLGSVQQTQGILDGAINNYRSGINNDPEHIGLRVALVAALRAQGKLDQAIEESKAALKVNALSMEVYNNFALCYLDKGDITLARFILQKAVQSIDGAEKNAYLQTNLGWAFYRDGNIPAATQALETAVELDPELVPALVYLSRVYMDDKNYGDTVDLLETAAKLDPKNGELQLTLGVAYRGVGRLDEARDAYNAALSLAPSNPDPHFNLGILLGDYEKDYDGAIAAFSQYIGAGGTRRDQAQQYIEDVQKEKKRAEKRAKAETDREAREAERARRDELLKEAEEEEARRKAEEERLKAEQPTPGPQPDETAPPEEPAPDEEPVDDAPPAPAPAPEPSDEGPPGPDDPWGGDPG